MNDHNTNTRLSPVKSIVIYHDRYKQNFYLEQRDIKNIQGKTVLMAPVPLSDDVMRSIGRCYVKTNTTKIDHGTLIPGHILFGSSKPGMTVVMWYRPPMMRNLNLSTSLKIKGEASVNVPATLYLVMNSKLYVYALMTSVRPDAKTKLYKAPFFNIYEDGNVCLGTAKVGKVKGRTYEEEGERFERAFFMAEQNGGNSKNNCKTPLEQLWTKQIKSKAVFPCKQELIQHPTYKTVGELINKLIGKNDRDYD